MIFIFRRVSLPRHQKQRTHETSEKRIQDGKTRDMLRGVVSHISMLMKVGGGEVGGRTLFDYLSQKTDWNDNLHFEIS